MIPRDEKTEIQKCPRPLGGARGRKRQYLNMIVERQLLAGLENQAKFKTLIGYKLQNFAFFQTMLDYRLQVKAMYILTL